MNASSAPQWAAPAEPLRLPRAAFTAGLAARDAWRCLRAASAPFRAGTRFQALPDVRFWSGGARLRAPGARLPGRGDRSAGGYRSRLQGDGIAAFALRVDEPLLVDAALWAGAHTLLRSALGADVVPVLPVQTALTLIHGSDAPPWTWPAGHVRLVAVLEGRLRTAPGEDITAGDAVWLPAGIDAHHDDGTVALVLALAADPATLREATRAAAEAMLLRLLDNAWEDDGRVSMLGFPPAASARGVKPMPALQALARALGAAPLHAALSDALALDAALRASSLGLAPRPVSSPEPLRERACLRLCAQGIVRLRLDDARWLVAANGHALVAEDRAEWRRLWARLCDGGAHRVDALTGRGRRAGDLREWLDALRAVGGVRAEGAG